jgi:nucleoside 2-deoxyribosyltransferase
MNIYLAGPLFTTYERDWNTRLAEFLRTLGHGVWLPQEKEPRNKTANSIFERDREGVDWADVVVANMDGPDPDSGTCWEAGYAYGIGTPVINYRTDFRNNGDIADAKFNLMLYASSCLNLDWANRTARGLAEMLDSVLKPLNNQQTDLRDLNREIRTLTSDEMKIVAEYTRRLIASRTTEDSRAYMATFELESIPRCA